MITVCLTLDRSFIFKLTCWNINEGHGALQVTVNRMPVRSVGDTERLLHRVKTAAMSVDKEREWRQDRQHGIHEILLWRKRYGQECVSGRSRLKRKEIGSPWIHFNFCAPCHFRTSQTKQTEWRFWFNGTHHLVLLVLCDCVIIRCLKRYVCPRLGHWQILGCFADSCSSVIWKNGGQKFAEKVDSWRKIVGFEQENFVSYQKLVCWMQIKGNFNLHARKLVQRRHTVVTPLSAPRGFSNQKSWK